MTRFLIGLDCHGQRHQRMRNVAEMQRAREGQRLRPKLVFVATCAAGQQVWRNGLHRRRWLLLRAQLCGDRRCFLMTLRRPPLVTPILPF